MSHTISDLMTRLGLVTPAAGPPSGSDANRHVMVHVTIDAQHATPLRRSLIRDCAGESWTIRVTPLHNKDRLRLTLILPEAALHNAIDRLSNVTPSARVSGLLEVPHAPSDAWRNLMDRSVPIGGKSDQPTMPARSTQTALSGLLTPGYILLGANIADRDALFHVIARFLEVRHLFSRESVFSCLADREALGSTALGEGVAVPRGQLEALTHAVALYIRPSTPFSYAAPDGKPVSDVIALFVPERVSMTHLHLLGEVAEYFCDHRFRERIHQCRDANAVSRLFAEISRNGPVTG